MLQKETAPAAPAPSDAGCGHCQICSPDCPIAIARRAMRGLRDDLIAAEEMEQDN